MKVLQRIQKIPAGTLLIPIAIGAVLNTFVPQIFQIGDPVQSMFTGDGMSAFVGLQLFFTGTQLRLQDLKSTAKRGVPLVVFKYLLTYGLSFLVLQIFGLEGFLGISFLAFTAAFTSSNASLYLGTIQPYCDQADEAIFGIFVLFSSPVIPMLFLSSLGGQQNIDFMPTISLIVPFVFGFILGNLDSEFRKMFAQGNNVILPFIGFQFGSYINLFDAVQEIPTGLLLTICIYLLSMGPQFLFDRKVLKRPGYASIASISIAGVGLAIPILAGEASAMYQPFAEKAVAQLALVMLLTTFITPFITKFAMKKLYVPET